MKLICGGNDLADAVSKVFKAVSVRTTNPILEGIKLKAEQGSLQLTATDTELTIQKAIVADVKIEGETVVPGRFFSEFVKKLIKEQIELSVDEKNRLIIKYMDSEGVLQCLAAEDYPQIKTLDDGESFKILSSRLKELITKTSFSVALDGARPALKGLLLEVDRTKITAVALDGYRLAKCVKDIESTTALLHAIVPARCINEIARLLENVDEIVTVYVFKQQIMLQLNHTCIISRLIDEDFINYKLIIPTNFSSDVTLPCGQFEGGLERAILLSKIEKNNLVKFEIKSDTMLLSSSGDIGNVLERIPVRLNGDDITIAFNARYFTEILKYIGTDNLTILFTNSVSPCVVVPSGSVEDILYLILPVKMVG